MCVVSNIGDQFNKQWPNVWPPSQQPVPMPGISYPVFPSQQPVYDGPTRAQMQEVIDLLKKAREIDKFLGTPDCDNAEKLEKLRAYAKHLGLDVDAVLK